MPVTDAVTETLRDPLPLFPLQTVLFPGASLGLKVFESRYLDLVSECLRGGLPFGVVHIDQGTEAGRSPVPMRFATIGVLTRIDEVDAEQPGILRVRCTATQRFRRIGEPREEANGLWVTRAEAIADDPVRLPGPSMLNTVQALAGAIKSLTEQGKSPFTEPYRLDDAGWVANRWCELLPITATAKQKLMELEDPMIRLSLVDGFLRDKKVVVG